MVERFQIENFENKIEEKQEFENVDLEIVSSEKYPTKKMKRSIEHQAKIEQEQRHIDYGGNGSSNHQIT